MSGTNPADPAKEWTLAELTLSAEEREAVESTPQQSWPVGVVPAVAAEVKIVGDYHDRIRLIWRDSNGHRHVIDVAQTWPTDSPSQIPHLFDLLTEALSHD